MNATYLAMDMVRDTIVISPYKSFGTTCINIDEVEELSLNSLCLAAITQFDYHGTYHRDRLKTTLFTFIRSLGNTKETAYIIAKIFTEKIIKPFLLVTGMPAFWLKIKVMEPQHYAIFKEENSCDLILTGVYGGSNLLFVQDTTAFTYRLLSDNDVVIFSPNKTIYVGLNASFRCLLFTISPNTIDQSEKLAMSHNEMFVK